MRSDGAVAVAPTPASLTLAGVRARTLAALQDVLPADCFIADLSLGAWRSRHVALEFAAQLGITFPSGDDSANVAPFTGLTDDSYASIVGQFIDAESQGDRATLVALECAETLAAAVPAGAQVTFAVVAPRFGLPWRRDNVLFVRFFAEALSRREASVLLVDAGDAEPGLPDEWSVEWAEERTGPETADGGEGLLSLIPGTIAPEVAAQLDVSVGSDAAAFLALPGGHLLVAPERRRPPEDVSPLDFDRLAVAARGLGWIEAYAAHFGNTYFVDPWLLADQALREVGEGGGDLALHLLERARACGRTADERTALQALLQGVRIALQRFAEAAAEDDPPESAADDLKTFLLQSKGWALLMADGPQEAEPYFEAAIASTPPPRRERLEYLYLLNIAALNRLRLGDGGSALALEREVEQRHGRAPRRDWRLEYVNAINIARLLRREGRFDDSERYYRRAFETTLGVRSEGDRIYTNLCLARIFEDQGRTRDAFSASLRAALHWLSATAPEAVGARVTGAILMRSVAAGEDVVEEVSEALAARLSASVDETRATPPPAFVQVESLTAFRPGSLRAYGDSEVGVAILTTAEPVSSRRSGPAFARLQRIVSELLRGLWPETSFAEAAGVVVDHRLGRELPSTASEVVETCVRLGIDQAVVDGERLLLTDEVRSTLERRLRVRNGSAIDELSPSEHGSIATFKRYLAPCLLDEDDTRLVAALHREPTVAELDDDPELLSGSELVEWLRRLERARVIELSLPDDAAGGLRAGTTSAT